MIGHERAPGLVRMLVLACTLGAAHAQAPWRQLAVPSIPVPDVSVCYDSANDRVLRFRGYPCGGAGRGTLWELVGSAWQQITSAMNPPRLSDAEIVYDPFRRRVVLFGGSVPDPSDATWEWDGTTWTERAVSPRPPARLRHAMVFDPVRRHVVLFGGSDGSISRAMNDTWTWDGTAWTEHQPARRPPRLSTHVMAYDPWRDRVVLFGGFGIFGLLNETWEWDGQDWTQVIDLPVSPEPRHAHAMAFDPSRGQIVLFGGLPAFVGGEFPETWAFDGRQWTILGTGGPTPRGHASLVYDEARGSLLLHGGATTFSTCLGDLWEFDSATPGFAGFGAGCPGEAGIPLLSLMSPQVPPGGGVLGLRISQLSASPSAIAVFAFSGSRQQWIGLSLPAPLTVLGLPRCSLWAGLDLLVPGARTQPGIADLSLRVPGSLTLYIQGLAVDPTGLSLSGAASIDTSP